MTDLPELFSYIICVALVLNLVLETIFRNDFWLGYLFGFSLIIVLFYDVYFEDAPIFIYSAVVVLSWLSLGLSGVDLLCSFFEKILYKNKKPSA